jgi:endonuclease/exonuclease/phosphatase family metal-dependent hydrolase
MSAISLLSINIEQHVHLDRVQPFFVEHRPDVICLQEVLEQDVERFATSLGYRGEFAPMHDILSKSAEAEPRNRKGIAILTSGKIVTAEKLFYGNFPVQGMQARNPKVIVPDHAVLQHVTINCNGEQFSVANTHFTWSPTGEEVTYDQQQNLERLLALLERYPEVILCGDFNSPRSTRGDTIFDALATHYTDNIPTEITSTVDPNLHRVPGLEYVIDGLFSTPNYTAEDVKIWTGLSDHCGITAKISNA